jgi:rhamnosyltransferase
LIIAVIVTYNIGAAFLDCFNSIKNQVDFIIIVDNGSNDNTTNMLKGLESKAGVKIFYNSENMGIAAALNIGIKEALNQKADWILLLDHDSHATSGMIDKLIQSHNEFMAENVNLKIGIVAPVPYEVNSNVYLKKIEKRKKFSLTRAVISSGTLINSKILLETGFFTENLFLYYVDTDFCIRVRKAGYQILLANEAVLLHSVGTTVVRKFLWFNVYYNSYSPIANYYVFRNGVYILNKHVLYAPYYFYEVIKRQLFDLAMILLYGNDKYKNIKFSLQGLIHGIIGNMSYRP